MNNKHLTFEECSIIEDLLNKGEKIHKIAKKLGRPDSSIVSEVQRNRYVCHTATKEKCLNNRFAELNANMDSTQAFSIKFWKACVKGLFGMLKY